MSALTIDPRPQTAAPGKVRQRRWSFAIGSQSENARLRLQMRAY